MENQESMTSAEIFKEKRKWQIALRRYVLEQQASPFYAPYFGLPIYMFREWIEMQFDETLSWDNFSSYWQFDHIVPIAYFNFRDKNDLMLCWNFTNIRTEKKNLSTNGSTKIDVIAAKAYFQELLDKTGYRTCRDMIKKIESVERAQIKSNENIEAFILNNLSTLEELQSFGQGDFERVNWGMSIDDVIAENKLLAKFGN